MSHDNTITEADRELHRKMGGVGPTLDEIAAQRARTAGLSAMAAGAPAPGLSAEETHIAKAMGLDLDEWAMTLAAARAAVAQIPAPRRDEVAALAGGHWNVVAMASHARRMGLVT